MSRHRLQFGAAPAFAPQARPEDKHYLTLGTRRRICALVYRRMLERVLPVPETVGACYVVEDCFPALPAVVLFYAQNCARACTFAQSAWRQRPVQWDAAARLERAWYEQKQDYLARIARREIAHSDVPQEYRRVEPPAFPFPALSQLHYFAVVLENDGAVDEPRGPLLMETYLSNATTPAAAALAAQHLPKYYGKRMLARVTLEAELPVN